VSGVLQQALQVVPGTEVDAGRMLQNLELTKGLVLVEAASIALSQRIWPKRSGRRWIPSREVGGVGPRREWSN